MCLQRIIIYPNYIDSKKTVAEGRRIPKDKGVNARKASFKVAATCRPAGVPDYPIQKEPKFHIHMSAGCDFPNVKEITDSCVIGLSLKAEYEVRGMKLIALSAANFTCQ